MDQPTLIRDTPSLQTQFKKNKTSNTIKYQPQTPKTKQTNSVLPIDFLKNDNKIKSIYENLYTIDESIVSDQQVPCQFRLRQIQQDQNDQIYIKKLYSKNSLNPMLGQSKKSLKGEYLCQPRFPNKSEKSHVSDGAMFDDKEHRLNFMIGKLNL